MRRLRSAFLVAATLLLCRCSKSGSGEGAPAAPAATVLTATVLTPQHITDSTALCDGSVAGSGSSLPVTARGICYGVSPSPTTAASVAAAGSGTGDFRVTLTGLVSGTTYYARAFATNAGGTVYSAERSFRTPVGPGGTVTDIDGNLYHVIRIGTQVWMLENLRTTHYSDGAPIIHARGSTEWEANTLGAYANYDDDTSKLRLSGRHYNWYAVARGLAPAGWHVPTSGEYQTLIDYLGGYSVAGGKLKHAGNDYWYISNAGATNSSGFTAMPAGERQNGNFIRYNEYGCLWTSDPASGLPFSGGRALGLFYYSNEGSTSYYFPRNHGLAVRCIRD
ncbi:MAG: hypothetical protein EOO11_10320 [Chitinophagaceae bacterium]|nr:MAG: hypothetical protein EOO11_10320 [Chitinophagaceae bacterium]